MKWVPEKHQINDSTELIAFKTEKFKTAILKLSMVAPMTTDPTDTAMFSLMINILRSGTEKYPEKEDLIKRLNDLCDASCSIGGYASGDNRILEISSEMLDERFFADESILEGVMGVMNEMLLHPRTENDGVFRTEAIEREKKVISDKIKSEKNNSRDYATRKCREIMCKGEPYGQVTEIPELMAIKRDELWSFYKKFLSEAQITFSYVGALSGEIVAEKIRRIFLGLPLSQAAKLNPLVSHEVKKMKEITEKLNIKQGVWSIGFRTGTLFGDRDAHVMAVFNNIFGGTFMSRLFKIIREKQSLCYYCSSDYVSTKALMYVSCGIETSNYERVRDEIFAQLKLLRENHVTGDELRVAKELAIKELREVNDYPAAIATFCYSRVIYKMDETLESLAAKIETVTAEDVMRIALKIEPDTVFFLKGTRVDEEGEEDFDE